MNKVAELQGVAVLNINDLAIAVKPAVIPGEQILSNWSRAARKKDKALLILKMAQ